MFESDGFGDDWDTQLLRFGSEKQPILVIDNFHPGCDQLLDYACNNQGNFEPVTQSSYPGVRIECPKGYSDVIKTIFNAPQVRSSLGISGEPEVLSCYFSIITTPEDELELAQKLPHIDAANDTCFALIHYLCDGTFGGTNFYRHIETGYEYIDTSRYLRYQQVLFNQVKHSTNSNASFISGNSRLFELIGGVSALWNRAAIYPGKILHAGVIPDRSKLDLGPKKGRLTTTSIISLK